MEAAVQEVDVEKKLRLSPDLKLPHDAVTQTVGILGKVALDQDLHNAFPGPGKMSPIPPRAPAPSRAIPPPATPRAAPARREGANGAASPEGLDKAQRTILTVLAQFPEGCVSGKLTLLAGYRWSGGFRNALSALRSAGFIDGSNGGVMTITDAGRAALGSYDPLPTGPALVDYWMNHPSFGACERAVVKTLRENRQGLPALELAEAAGYEWSGGFRNALSSLRTAGVIVGRNSEVMRLNDELVG